MAYDKNKVDKLMADLLIALPGFNPLEVPKDDTPDAAQRFALASMYKEKPFREYMLRAIRLNIERFQNVENERGLYTQQGRVQVLKELYMLSQQMFNESQKIDKHYKEDKAKLDV